MAKKEPGKNDRAIINKQLEIHFTPGSADIMPGSYFVLDSLGDTMTSFGNTYLRVEGNTDATGNPTANMTLSDRRALSVKNYILKNFPNVDANRFQTIGRGAANPVADNATEVARPFGFLMGAFPPIHYVFERIMAPLRYMPISAFIPLLILWFGIYEKEKTAFLFLGVFVYLLPVVVSAIRSVPEELVQTALTLGASKMQVIRTVLLPAALPDIFDSFRVMNAILWTYVILAEAVNPERGLGYMVVFLGPSGCGKSTLLKAVAGILPPTRGEILVDGVPVVDVGRDRGMVFQAYTSFAWLTVRDNVEYGLRLRGVRATERREQSDKYLRSVGLVDFADRYPKDLSGGMKQRVAIARTLINKPKLVLMDEPFGALDPQTRWGMQSLPPDVARTEDNTILFVTYDVSEAVYLADTIYVLAPRPTRILHRIDVPFFENRDIALKSSTEFRKVEKELLDLLYVK